MDRQARDSAGGPFANGCEYAGSAAGPRASASMIIAGRGASTLDSMPVAKDDGAIDGGAQQPLQMREQSVLEPCGGV